MRRKIAVAGAGIYGSVAAIKLAEAGNDVYLFDPLGIMQAASGINQYRVHAGYHYPRSVETVMEVMQARGEFIAMFSDAIVRNASHYYAIPRAGSLTTTEDYVSAMDSFGLPLREVKPDWMDFGYIDTCWEVDEYLFDPEILRQLLKEKLESLDITFEKRRFEEVEQSEYDFVVYATYGLSGSHINLFSEVRFQVAEKILVRFPEALQHVSLVVVDGPFTAFDAYGSSDTSLFGSARYTNHWTSYDESEPLPEQFVGRMNLPTFEPFENTRFEQMVEGAMEVTPLAKDAEYLGSRFTMRIVENRPGDDRRILHVRKSEPGVVHLFSGKVVSAVKAAELVCQMVEEDG
ncbi:FAD-dependent oxidoreductase [Jiella mangrovi]|uniref:FAD-binding oxidoreductase n=1 Tax=Jiella mangrovi TaxID=2821407 RepID=A0ABS4BJE5_9HYPH|nr:FAD-dependent oxidoreductase [Jiella mangrovi]MBP0616672.1 FAD-binding oxidoreductase [Jiella mangrovi]